MTPDSKLKAGLEGLGLHVEPGLDTSAGDEYAVYWYRREGALYGDDAPCIEYRRWSVVYVAPVGQNRIAQRTAIQRMIWELFAVWPEEDDDSDKAGQRYIYEFDTIGGINDGAL